MLTSLDPHSNYLDAKALQDFQTSMRGEEFGGLGLEVMQDHGLVRSSARSTTRPAARAGVMAGDLIVKIDDTPVKGLTLKQAVDKMRGPANTSMWLISVERGELKDAKVFDIVREIIHVQPVRSRVEGGDIGYIRITQFNEQTYDALKAALAKLPRRSRLGEHRRATSSICATIPAVCCRSRSASSTRSSIPARSFRRAGAPPTSIRNTTPAPGYNLSGGKPMAVLINGGSASASEIVSGALQDLKRATLLGTRSFGKGSVQTVLPLGEDGALKLTTARYYTPSGRSIQAKGIEPDYKVLENIPDDLKGKVESLGEASLQGHLKNGDDEQKGSDAYVPPDTTKDTQLTAAIDLLHGKPPIVKASNDPQK